MIIPIFSRQNLKSIPDTAIVWFLVGPTLCSYAKNAFINTYDWRRELIDVLNQQKFNEDIYVIIPEPVDNDWSNLFKMDIWDEWEDESSFKNVTDNIDSNSQAFRQIAWETLALERANYVLANMSLYWDKDIKNGKHGNIGPTVRWEAGQLLNRKHNEVLFYIPNNKEFKNNAQSVTLGKECYPDSVTWIEFHAIRNNFPIARNIDQLINNFVQITNK